MSCLVSSFIFLCISLLFLFLRFSTSLQLSFSHSSFASSRFFLIIFYTAFYSLLPFSLIVRLSFIRSNISSIIHLFFFFFGNLGLILFADSTSASLKLFHFAVS